MIPKPSPAVDPLTPDAPSLAESMPTPAGAAATPQPQPQAQPEPQPRLRCIQRPTGEWFTTATRNAPGKDTPDATELWTEAEAREALQDLGVPDAEVEGRIAAARATPEVSGDELPLPDPPVAGSGTARTE